MAEDSLAARLRETEESLAALLAAARALTFDADLDEVHRRVMDLFWRRNGQFPCFLWMRNEDGYYRVRHFRGVPPEFVKGLRLSFRDEVVSALFSSPAPKPDDPDRLFRVLNRPMEGFSSALHFPLIVDGRGAGFVTALAPGTGFHDADRLWVLSGLSDGMAMAVKTSHEHDALRHSNRRMASDVLFTTQELSQTNLKLIRHIRELEALYEISALMLSGREEGEFFSRVAAHALALADLRQAAFFLRAEGRGGYVPAGGEAQIGAVPLLRTETLEPFHRRLMAGETLPLMSLTEVRLFFPESPSVAGLLCPLILEGELVGVLAAGKRGPVEEQDARTLSLLAGQASQYLLNRRLMGEKDRRLKDLSALQEVYSILAEEPDLEKTLRHAVQKVAAFLGADICAFLLYEEATRELVTQPGAWGLPEGGEPLLYRVRLDDPLTSSGRVFLDKEPFLSDDAQQDARLNSRYAKLWNYRSLIVAPLIVGDKCIGVLRVGHRRPGVFTADHLRLAMLVAEHAAVVVENARLHHRARGSVKDLRRKNELKTEFLSMVSHELMSPLSSVEGFMSILLKGEAGPVTEQQKDFLTLCSNTLKRVTALADDLLDISRIEAGTVKVRPEPLDLGGLLAEALRAQGHAAREKGVSLEAVPHGALPRVQADPHRIRQVVDNLLTNALKFTPSGGMVALSARREGEEVVVTVRDTGIGLSEAEREKVFERYYQVERRSAPRRGRGAGLGLAICKSLVEHHGGRIWVESNPGRGSAFHFSLPIVG